jgi:hypothetical protein
VSPHEPNTEGWYLLRHVLDDVVCFGRFDREGFWDVYREVPSMMADRQRVMALYELGPRIDLNVLFNSGPPVPWNVFCNEHRWW